MESPEREQGRVSKMNLHLPIVFSSFPASNPGHSLTFWSWLRFPSREVKVVMFPNSMKTSPCSLTSLSFHPYGNHEYLHKRVVSGGSILEQSCLSLSQHCSTLAQGAPGSWDHILWGQKGKQATLSQIASHTKIKGRPHMVAHIV